MRPCDGDRIQRFGRDHTPEPRRFPYGARRSDPWPGRPAGHRVVAMLMNLDSDPGAVEEASVAFDLFCVEAWFPRGDEGAT